MDNVEKQITKFIVTDQASKLSDLAIGHRQIIFIKDKRKADARCADPYYRCRGSRICYRSSLL